MTTPITLLQITRQNTLSAIAGLSLDQVNKIPTGFSGNIAWHLGHMVATNQGLLYRLSGHSGNLDAAFVERYKKGSVPSAPINQTEFDFIKSALVQQIIQLQKDVDSGIFKTYSEYTTSYGNTIQNFDQALFFVNVHESLHLGYVMALKRVVLQ
ncbi:MAG: DinB family protein [Crocinitomicaceae bacterium]|nr:DinB family protein [Crocinitomicaceae bacterium]